MTLPRLLLLTDRVQVPSDATLVEHIEKCLDAGISHVVLREQDLPPSVRSELAEAMTTLGATVIAAGSALIGAAGIHQDSTARGATRHLVGRSCHSRAEVVQSAADRVTYATLGPFAATASKPGYGPPLDPSSYADLPIPTYALGGITPANAGAAIGAGAYGVAVMGAVMRSSDPARVVRDLIGIVG